MVLVNNKNACFGLVPPGSLWLPFLAHAGQPAATTTCLQERRSGIPTFSSKRSVGPAEAFAYIFKANQHFEVLKLQDKQVRNAFREELFGQGTLGKLLG